MAVATSLPPSSAWLTGRPASQVALDAVHSGVLGKRRLFGAANGFAVLKEATFLAWYKSETSTSADGVVSVEGYECVTLSILKLCVVVRSISALSSPTQGNGGCAGQCYFRHTNRTELAASIRLEGRQCLPHTGCCSAADAAAQISARCTPQVQAAGPKSRSSPGMGASIRPTRHIISA